MTIEFTPFPTGVGMNRQITVAGGFAAAVPHRRGDEPRLLATRLNRHYRSPQAWG